MTRRHRQSRRSRLSAGSKRERIAATALGNETRHASRQHTTPQTPMSRVLSRCVLPKPRSAVCHAERAGAREFFKRRLQEEKAFYRDDTSHNAVRVSSCAVVRRLATAGEENLRSAFLQNSFEHLDHEFLLWAWHCGKPVGQLLET